jgi:predicted nucleic acid-binding protein
MSSESSVSTVLDTSVLVELAVDSTPSRALRDDILSGNLRIPLTGELNVMELAYVLCRRAGPEASKRSVGLLRRASQVRILSSSPFLDAAASLKCTRSISMTDCVTIAMGEALSAPVLFARHERELDLELDKKPFTTSVLYLEDRTTGKKRPGGQGRRRS